LRTVKLGSARVGNYRLRRVVRPSARGVFYVARNVHTGRDVMLELIDADPGIRAQLAQETRAANKVAHRGIVDLLDQGVSDRGVWFANEKLRGESLARRLRRKRLDADEVAHIFSQLIDIVAAFQKMALMHGGLDVSQVVLEETAADKIRVRLLDFGIVRKADKLFASFAANEKDEARQSAERNALITRGLNVDILGLGKLLKVMLPKRFPRDRFAREYHYLRVAELCTADKPGKQLRDCAELGRQFQLASVKVATKVEPSQWMYAFLVFGLVVVFGLALAVGYHNRALPTGNAADPG
jgi:serine/threonine protein kinase